MNNSTHAPAKTSKSTKEPAESGNGKAAAEHAVADAVPKSAPARILVIDLGGTKVKVLATGETEVRKAESGPAFSPANLVENVEKLAEGWQYEAVSLGYPGRVGPAGPSSEAGNLAPGWVGFDFAAAFKMPVRVLNDAAMQALGSYEGGRMLFIGLGTGLGSTLISQNAIVPLELGGLRYSRTQTLGQVLGREGLRRIGKKAWRAAVASVVHEFISAFEVEYVVLGGGNSKEVKELPAGARLGHNQTAFRGGFRLWNLEDVQTLSPGEIPDCPGPPATADWRIL
ncbi:MAG TPA: ROK family protein [Planctomycetaceae bacterium]|nr:ROK family protein [Planctomycetaceae bacterium]